MQNNVPRFWPIACATINTPYIYLAGLVRLACICILPYFCASSPLGMVILNGCHTRTCMDAWTEHDQPKPRWEGDVTCHAHGIMQHGVGKNDVGRRSERGPCETGSGEKMAIGSRSPNRGFLFRMSMRWVGMLNGCLAYLRQARFGCGEPCWGLGASS